MRAASRGRSATRTTTSSVTSWTSRRERCSRCCYSSAVSWTSNESRCSSAPTPPPGEALGPYPPPLVIWGGYPGEWEGEHPHTVASSLGVDGVFFAGWRGHEDLPTGFNCADVFVAPSVDEPFGQVYLEAMACGLPVIATDSGGPQSFINTDPTQSNGWRVPPDDETKLVDAIIEAASDESTRRRRGRNARLLIEHQYDWRHVTQHIERIYSNLLD